MRLRELRKLVEEITGSGGGGGGSLVVGSWTDVAHEGWPFDNQGIGIAPVSAVSEFEVQMQTSPGDDDVFFRIENSETDEVFGGAQQYPGNIWYLKVLIPAGAPVRVIRFGNDAQSASVPIFRRRTLA